jgi:hypothetical protein
MTIKHELKESDFKGFTVRSVIAGSSKAMLFVETDVIDGHVTYCVESKEYDNPFLYSYLGMAIEMYNKLCR